MCPSFPTNFRLLGNSAHYLLPGPLSLCLAVKTTLVYLLCKYLLNTNTQVVAFNAAMFWVGALVVLLVSQQSYQVGTLGVITREVKKSIQGYRKEPGSLAPTRRFMATWYCTVSFLFKIVSGLFLSLPIPGLCLLVSDCQPWIWVTIKSSPLSPSPFPMPRGSTICLRRALHFVVILLPSKNI